MRGGRGGLDSALKQHAPRGERASGPGALLARGGVADGDAVGGRASLPAGRRGGLGGRRRRQRGRQDARRRSLPEGRAAVAQLGGQSPLDAVAATRRSLVVGVRRPPLAAVVCGRVGGLDQARSGHRSVLVGRRLRSLLGGAGGAAPIGRCQALAAKAAVAEAAGAGPSGGGNGVAVAVVRAMVMRARLGHGATRVRLGGAAGHAAGQVPGGPCRLCRGH
mmetsp:Transcript_25626/g.96487  ORF Transcript_25626/g.96487 Transcript_25626/m.96487 type:complete len:220 (+) Transcript_25626:1142-1801(+)